MIFNVKFLASLQKLGSLILPDTSFYLILWSTCPDEKVWQAATSVADLQLPKKNLV